jgi:hypothetical protein
MLHCGMRQYVTRNFIEAIVIGLQGTGDMAALWPSMLLLIVGLHSNLRRCPMATYYLLHTYLVHNVQCLIQSYLLRLHPPDTLVFAPRDNCLPRA